MADLAPDRARRPAARGRRAALAAAGLAVLTLHAAPATAGEVAGKIKIDNEAALGPPPLRARGFTDRLPNPLKTARRFNPRPMMIVVLEPAAGGDDSATDGGPRRVRYELLGESFERPLLAVQVGTEVEIKNSGRNAPVLLSPSHRDKLPAGPLNPSATAAFTVDTPHEPVEIRAQHTAHLRGAVVAFPGPHFAQVDEDGNFEIKDVPAGKWKLRVWYRDGWLARPDDAVEVGARRTRIDPVVSSKLTMARADGAK